MKIETPLVKWYITFMLICFGYAFLFGSGLISKIAAADVTKLSFLIGGLLMYYSIQVGSSLKRLVKVPRGPLGKNTIKAAKKFLSKAKFAAGIFFDLGMIGTVIGFIFMLGISFTELSTANTSNMKMALQHMGTGMATALYTTAAGLICSLALHLQLYPFEKLIEEKENEV